MNKNTTHQNQTDVIDTVLQLLLDNDQNALAEGFRVMVNEAMKAERSYALNAAPYERSQDLHRVPPLSQKMQEISPGLPSMAADHSVQTMDVGCRLSRTSGQRVSFI